ncbi:MAP7 domain-containing protein [Pseudoalteromonas sp. MMG005]|uniref:MAP7 domain-containing protein n=1 Tax=Pseudoalteromonas sp. MMG005 TaxID=2822682 RepID=UPI001B3A1D80|nr:MAP7 domain-containing protein [Pseudoalteromonas sp. MMG005]MBQ4847002.1 hypothetical protein [Pseudoalteromonas sp. MMG005]
MKNILFSSLCGLAAFSTLLSNNSYATSAKVDVQSYMDGISFKQNDTSTNANKFKLGVSDIDVINIPEGQNTVEIKLLDTDGKKHAAWLCNTNVDYDKGETSNTHFLSCSGENSQHGSQYIDMVPRAYTMNFFHKGTLFQTYEFALEENEFVKGSKRFKVASVWDDYASIGEAALDIWQDSSLELIKPYPNTFDKAAGGALLHFHLIHGDKVIGESRKISKPISEGHLKYIRTSFTKPHDEGGKRLAISQLEDGEYHILVYKEPNNPIELYTFEVKNKKVVRKGRQLNSGIDGIYSDEGKNWFSKTTENLDRLAKNSIYPEDPKEIRKREEEKQRLAAQAKKKAEKLRQEKEAQERKKQQRIAREEAKQKKEQERIEAEKRKEQAQLESEKRDAELKVEREKQLAQMREKQAQMQQKLEKESGQASFSINQVLLGLVLMSSGLLIAKSRVLSKVPQAGKVVALIESKSCYVAYAAIGLAGLDFVVDLITLSPIIGGGLAQVTACASGILLLKNEPKLNEIELFTKAKSAVLRYEEHVGLTAIVIGVLHLFVGGLPLI